MVDRILLVEDDPALGKQVSGFLKTHEYEVTWLRDGRTAAREDPTGYELVILDLMLPGMDGVDVLRSMRRSSGVPVMILSARNERTDVVRALMLGADDYVTKPFWPEELAARVHTRLRRPTLQDAERAGAQGLEVDLEGDGVSVDGRSITLTRTEGKILKALVRRPGSTLTRMALVDLALDPEHSGNERTLDVHVSRLRRKLGACGDLIRTVWKTGYKFDPDHRP